MSIGQTAIRRWLQQYSAEQSGHPGIGKTADGRAAKDPPIGAGEPTTSAGCHHIKKRFGLLCPRNEMIYIVIRQLQKEVIPVQQSCRVLAVSRSGFYEAQRRSAKPVLCKASVHLRAAFMASHQSYGSRQLVTATAGEGFPHRALQGAQLDAPGGLKTRLEA